MLFYAYTYLQDIPRGYEIIYTRHKMMKIIDFLAYRARLTYYLSDETVISVIKRSQIIVVTLKD